MNADLTIEAACSLTIDSNIYLNTSLKLVTNHGLIDIKGRFDINEVFKNYGTITNYGDLKLTSPSNTQLTTYDGAKLFNYKKMDILGGSLTIIAGGNINNNHMATININGNQSFLSNYSSLINNGTIQTINGGRSRGDGTIAPNPVTLPVSLSSIATSSTTIMNNWTLNSNATIAAGHSLIIPDGYTLINIDKTITNNGYIANLGTFNNQHTVNNFGTFTNSGTVSLSANNAKINTELNGKLLNNATITISIGVIYNGNILNNSGTITINGANSSLIKNAAIINNGTIRNNGGTVEGSGTVAPNPIV